MFLSATAEMPPPTYLTFFERAAAEQAGLPADTPRTPAAIALPAGEGWEAVPAGAEQECRDYCPAVIPGKQSSRPHFLELPNGGAP